MGCWQRLPVLNVFTFRSWVLRLCWRILWLSLLSGDWQAGRFVRIWQADSQTEWYNFYFFTQIYHSCFHFHFHLYFHFQLKVQGVMPTRRGWQAGRFSGIGAILAVSPSNTVGKSLKHSAFKETATKSSCSKRQKLNQAQTDSCHTPKHVLPNHILCGWEVEITLSIFI